MKNLCNKLSLIVMSVLLIFVFFASCGYAADFGDSSLKLIVSDSSLFTPKDNFQPGKDSIFLQLSAPNEDKDKNNPDTVRLRLKSTAALDTEDVVLIETGNDTGIFKSAQGIALTSGHAMVGNVILQVAPARDTVMVIYSKDGAEDVIGEVNSTNAVERLRVLTSSVQTAGKPFGADVIAEDAQGNTLVAYSGKVKLTADGVWPKKLESKIYPEAISSFVNGKNSIFASYPDTGKIKISAKDDNVSGISEEINFLPAKFEVKVSQLQVAEKSFGVEVRALNFNNETTPSYEGTAFIKLADSGAVIKKNMRFKRGIATTDIAIGNCGEERFIVCDMEYPEICGISESVFFRPYKLKIEVNSPPKNRKNFYFDEVFKGRVIALGYSGKEVRGYAGVAKFVPVEGIDMPEKYYFDERGLEPAEFSMSGVNSVPFRLQASDIRFSDLKADSEAITLMPAKIKTELIQVKDNKAVLHIKIVDNMGMVVREDNSTMLSVYLAESNPNRSAFVEGSKKIKVKNGEAGISIIDDEREIVSVTVNSQDYYLGVEPLDITFK